METFVQGRYFTQHGFELTSDSVAVLCKPVRRGSRSNTFKQGLDGAAMSGAFYFLIGKENGPPPTAFAEGNAVAHTLMLDQPASRAAGRIREHRGNLFSVRCNNTRR